MTPELKGSCKLLCQEHKGSCKLQSHSHWSKQNNLREAVTNLAQFWPFNGIYMRAQMLLDIVGECTGCLFEDGLIGTAGS
jgi:hypothetical protein